MADRFDVAAGSIEDKGPVVACMVPGSKPGTSVVAPAAMAVSWKASTVARSSAAWCSITRGFSRESYPRPDFGVHASSSFGDLAPAPLSRYPVGHEQRRTPRTRRRDARASPEYPAVSRHDSRRFPGGEEPVVHVSRALHHYEGAKLLYATPKGGKLHVLELYGRILSVLKEWRYQQLEERMASESYSTFHEFRHTFATLMAQCNAHPNTARTILGHADMRTTLGTSSHEWPSRQRDTALADVIL